MKTLFQLVFNIQDGLLILALSFWANFRTESMSLPLDQLV